MNKIYSGAIGVVALTALVAGTAYAAFTTQATIDGVVLGTTTAGLQVKLGNEPDTDFASSRTMEDAFQLAPLSPGQVSTPGAFTLRNNGTVDLDLTAQITSAGGDWGTLAPVMQGITCLQTAAAANGGVCPSSGSSTTGWHHLSDWNGAPIALPGSPLVHGVLSPMYVSYYSLDSGVDNSYQGKTITNLTITINGNQSATQTALPTGIPTPTP